MELKKLKDELMNVDIEDTNSILKLLVYAYYYNDTLIEEGFYKDLYERLKVKYKPLTEDKETLKLYSRIKDNKAELTVEKYSFIMLEQLMVFIKGNVGIDAAIIERLLDYHNTVNKKFSRVLYSDNIKENIGNKVIALVNNNNRQSIESGKLSYDDGVVIDNKKMGDNVYKIKAGKKIIYYLYNPQKKKNKKKKSIAS